MRITLVKKTIQTGFTLIELVIVVGIVAILASVAYPSYIESIVKGRRAEGRAALAELMQQQERYLTQNNCYLAFTTAATGVATAAGPSPITACGGVTATSVPFKTFSGDSLAKAAYLLSAGVCDAGLGTLSIADCVRVIATPIVTDAKAGTLRMTSTGIKDCTGGTTPSVCWK